MPSAPEALRRAALGVLAAALAVSAAVHFPAPGSAVPADAPLRIRFDAAPTFHGRGRLTVRDAATGAAVHALDLAQAASPASPWPFRARIAQVTLNVRPLILAGYEAYFALPAGTLRPGAAYSVELDSGAFSSAGIPHPGARGNAWRFQTLPAPAAGKDLYEIAADGSGDFCTVQGALDFLPPGNDRPVTLRVHPGLYPEIVRSEGKHRITLLGTDRARCEIRYENNEKFNPGTAGRALARLFGNDVRIAGLTFRNATPNGGSQAEALYLEGQRVSVSSCDLFSFQDTMRLDGRIFLTGLLVEGAVDYVWGTGAAFFRDCVLRSVSDGYLVQARNARGAFGYVFVNCRLEAAPGVRTNYLARDGNGQFPDGDVRFIDCRMGSHVPAAGWLAATATPGAPNYLEYRSLDLAGNLLAVSGRAPASRQMTAAEASLSRDPVRVLGGSDGWDPEKAVVAGTAARPAAKPGAGTMGRMLRRGGRDALGRLPEPRPRALPGAPGPPPG